MTLTCDSTSGLSMIVNVKRKLLLTRGWKLLMGVSGQEASRADEPARDWSSTPVTSLLRSANHLYLYLLLVSQFCDLISSWQDSLCSASHKTSVRWLQLVASGLPPAVTDGVLSQSVTYSVPGTWWFHPRLDDCVGESQLISWITKSCWSSSRL